MHKEQWHENPSTYETALATFLIKYLQQRTNSE